MKNGFGHFKWIDGSEYIGNWKNNDLEGKGVYLWSDGRKY
jgi:hypothetical protein